MFDTEKSAVAGFDKEAYRSFEENPAMEASIQSKIEEAIAELVAIGKDPRSFSDDDWKGIFMAVSFTAEEREYSAKSHIRKLAQIAIGERILQTLDQHCKVSHDDIIPCLTAYFEAKANGELDAG